MSAGKPLVVQNDGTTIAPEDLDATHIKPGTNGQALITTGGATAWGSVPSTKVSYAQLSIAIGNSQSVGGVGPTTITGLSVQAAGAKFGSSGTGGITTIPFVNNNTSTVLCNYGTAASVWRVACAFSLTNTNNTAGNFIGLIGLRINGSLVSFPLGSTPIPANGTNYLYTENYFNIQAGQTLGIEVFGNGGGGNLLMSGLLYVTYVSSTV